MFGFPDGSSSSSTLLPGPVTEKTANSTTPRSLLSVLRADGERDGGSAVGGAEEAGGATSLQYLALYLVTNLTLTLYNKTMLNQFPFPYALTAIHALSSLIGTSLLYASNRFIPRTLSPTEWGVVGAFSVLYTVNIAVSNASLKEVSVPFHQNLRALIPFFTISISTILFGARYPRKTWISLIPVIFGVGLATYGDYSFSIIGFWMTLLGALLAALKTIATGKLQSGTLALGAMDMLFKMSLLAFLQSAALSSFTSESSKFPPLTNELITELSMNGVLAFILNLVSFMTNKKLGALSMTVASNIKQVLTILLGIVLFNSKIGFVNVIGISITLLGGAWYGMIELRMRRYST